MKKILLLFTFSLSLALNAQTGGILTGGPFEFCVGDGEVDNIPTSGITLSGESGTNLQWVVTDDLGNILGLPPNYDVVNFDDAPAGTCLVWHLAYEDGLTGLAMGNNAMTDLIGMHDFSNPISVVRNSPEGGTLSGGPYVFCVGNGEDDMIPAGDIVLTGNSGTNSQWVVTFPDGSIAGLPPSYDVVNFDGAGEGTCSVWHLSYADGLVGLEEGEQLSEIEGCYSLSNPIEVVRTNVNGGTLTGGPFAFCAGDGEDDMIPAGDIVLADNDGQNFQWVITFPDGSIAGLPPSYEVVNFDGAGEGTCSVWHLAYSDGLVGLEEGELLSEIEGCYSLSNPIEVVRSNPIGGTLTGGPFAFCVGNGEDDMIPAGDIVLAGNAGANSQWVVTFPDGSIAGLPPSYEVVNFDGAGEGTCSVWHLSYTDGLEGLEEGEQLSEIEGCYSLSNPIEVVRTNVNGGTLTGGPFQVCVGDGTADHISDGAIALTENEGANSQWIITDGTGNILGLPETYEDVDFDIAPVGSCFVWHLSYEDGLSGAEVGNNATTDLVGCFSLSNSVEVIRLDGTSSDCVTGISDLEDLSNQINAYPNPVVDQLSLEVGNLKDFDLNNFQLFDLTGKRVELDNYKTYGNRLVFNLSTLNSGVYILTLQNDESRIAKRIIKN